jgi:hypothetical protein
MSSDKTPPVVPATEAAPADPELLREEIAQTREELAETVQALAAKADVKGRARDKVAGLKDSAQDKVTQVAETARSRSDPLAEQVLLRTAEARGKAASVLSPEARRATADAARAVGQRPELLLGALAVLLAVLGVRQRRRARRTRLVPSP